MSNNYHFNQRKNNNYNNKKGVGNQKNNDYKKAQEENKKLKIELNQRKNVLKDYISRIKILQNELNQLQRQKNNNRNNTNRGRSNNNVRIQNNDFYDPFDDIMNSGGFNNLFFDGPFGFLPNRNIQRINPNFNPGDYEDYYEGNNINSLITGPRNNNYINNFNDESKIEQDIIDQLYPDPDKMTYEQLLELEENVGSVSKGLTKNQIKKIPKIKYNKNRFGKDDNKCVVCQYEFKNGEEVTKLSCGHLFHSDCVDTWLSKNKVCPMCHKEIIIK